MNTNQKHKGILSLISLSIYMNDIHEHPLLFCSPLDRKQYGNSWSCNKCNSYGPTFEAVRTGVWQSIGNSQEQLYDTPFGRILWRDVVMKAAEKWNNSR